MSRIIAVFALVASVALASGCRGGPNHVVRDPAYGGTKIVPRSDAVELALLYRADVQAQVAASAIVLNGEVVMVGKPPAAGSGVALATQAVVLRVTKVLRGTPRSDRVVVHFAVAGGATADPRAPYRLDPAIFREGARLLVWATVEGAGTEGERYVHPWETPGPVRAEGHAATRIRTGMR